MAADDGDAEDAKGIAVDAEGLVKHGTAAMRFGIYWVVTGLRSFKVKWAAAEHPQTVRRVRQALQNAVMRRCHALRMLAKGSGPVNLGPSWA